MTTHTRPTDARPTDARDRTRTPRLRVLLTGLLMPLTASCSVATKLDYGHVFSRQGWQRTDEVIETLVVAPGDTIADLGAGDGYFSFYFADAVGPEGRVYAVDVDREKIETLREEVDRRGYSNIEVVLAEPDDPGLPEAAVDLVFLCNAYHHFDDRVPYFTRLHASLAPGARVAIVDGKSEGAATLFIPEGHSLEPVALRGELEEAGYAHIATYDFLPLQSFDVFATTTESAAD